MNKLLTIMVSGLLTLFVPSNKGRADIFGGDVAVLLEILANNIKQLYQLMEMVQKSSDNLRLLRDINAGVSDALVLVESLKEIPNIYLYKDWKTVNQALQQISVLYGKIPKSKLAKGQQNSDLAVAEAITLNNHLLSYATENQKTGKKIKDRSQVVSPKGAAKLSAQSLGVLVENSGESLRAQATSLKMQAQQMATENQKNKEETEHFMGLTHDLSDSLKHKTPKFTTPRF